MGLGQQSRYCFIALGLLCLGCATQGTIDDQPSIVDSLPISDAVQAQDWNRVLHLTKDKKDRLFQLVRLRALYEKEEYQALLSAPKIEDRRYGPYDRMLRIFSAYESKRYESVFDFEIPAALPSPLKERLLMIQGASYRELKQMEKARATYKAFLKRYRGSPLQTDVMLGLADVETTLGNKEEALKLYETVYRLHPTDDNEDLARQRLVENDQLDALDADTHLTRIRLLQRATLFRKAERELESLRKKNPQHEARLELAYGKLIFAQKKYKLSEQLSRKALSQIKGDSELKIDWQELLSLSLSRQGEGEKSLKEYENLLKMNVSSSLKEIIFLRMGAIHLDEDRFEKAADTFKDLRKQFPNGRFKESAHWFEAWSRIRLLRSPGNHSNSQNKEADELLTTLPKLPEGKNFGPQAYYWRAHLASDRSDHEAHKNLTHEIREKWNISFYHLISQKNPFFYLHATKLQNIKGGPYKVSSDVAEFQKELSWQRLEAFRKVWLQSWAKLELKDFLRITRKRSKDIKVSVAERLQALEDWQDLVRWSVDHFGDPLSNAGDTKTLKFLYPNAYSDSVLKAAREFDISPFLLWGVMREESRFETEVVSIAGAVGLMQIMPGLAERIGRSLNEPPHRRQRITDPRRNIRYGAFHLSEIERQVERMPVPKDLHPVLQIAAYNAGLQAVSRWIREKDTSRVDIFVESIPFTETRQYVKRVLQSTYMYYRLYAEGAKEVARVPDFQRAQYWRESFAATHPMRGERE